MENAFGNNLKYLRTGKKMTQKELATYMNVNVVTICHWEKGMQEPCMEDIRKLSKFFLVSSDFLIGM
jgi:transcriptional regulator with XRE-family HTH domain